MPVTDRARKRAPISSPAAAMPDAPRPALMAIAFTAFSGCTGIGSRCQTPVATYSSPAPAKTAVALRWLTVIRAIASGMRRAESPKPPLTSRTSAAALPSRPRQ